MGKYEKMAALTFSTESHSFLTCFIFWLFVTVAHENHVLLPFSYLDFFFLSLSNFSM